MTYRGYPELCTLERGLCSQPPPIQLPQGVKRDEKAGSEQKKNKKRRKKMVPRSQLSCRAPHGRTLGMLNTHRVSRKDWTREIHVLVDRSVIWLGKSSKLERAGGCKRTQKDALHKPASLFLLSMHLL